MEIQKKNQEIQTYKTHYEAIEVKTPKDLLLAVPIVSHKDYRKAKLDVMTALLACSDVLGLSMSDNALELITMDLIDKYQYESIEDIIYCLKKGRQGFYGNNYNKLNLIVISEWMANHLENKASEREKMIKNNFKENKNTLEDVDYEAYKTRMKEKKPESKTIDETEYELYKLKYLSNDHSK